MPYEEGTRAGILLGCPSLDRWSREAEVEFEPRTSRLVNRALTNWPTSPPFRRILVAEDTRRTVYRQDPDIVVHSLLNCRNSDAKVLAFILWLNYVSPVRDYNI
ncbi:hypothetical protein T265_06332 [Opisthorchis viverrini]|uniref:Uncharacterized protein n=1 Tax=Opisthorchis viverrini TaxID=6198 RepID=A0A074ZSR4_OPIVI|nr:hypothetical protein T265_06332 [Opisthorchis viverrini]KER26415.1 hypothetical protein T265_06332 [Opisthorchis viverrini]